MFFVLSQNGFAEEIPTSKRLEKQDVVIQEIKRKLQISNLDNLASLRYNRQCNAVVLLRFIVNWWNLLDSQNVHVLIFSVMLD